MPLMPSHYFGSLGDGHIMYAAGEPPARRPTENRDFLTRNPWRLQVDGTLCPPGQQFQGRCLIHHKDGWTALAFWDRTIDERNNSCSVFLAQGEHSFSDMLMIARRDFPAIVARYPFNLELVT